MEGSSTGDLREIRASDTPSPAPWHILDVLGVAGLTILLTAVLAWLVAHLSGLDAAPRALRGVLLPLPLALLGSVTIAWVQVRYRAGRRLFGPRPAELRDLWRGTGWGITAFFGINIGLGLVLQTVARAMDAELPAPQERVREFAGDPVLILWLLVTAVVVAPLCEELFFRGMVLPALRRRMSAGWSIGMSAMIFASAHFVAEPTGRAGLLVFVVILPIGLLLGWVFERRGSLAVPIVLHATFNLLSTMALAAGQAGVPPH